MNILILGSGKAYGGTDRCFPPQFDRTFLLDAQVSYLDNDPAAEPTFITDITSDGWWLTCPLKYDVIVDAISHIGPHISKSDYNKVTLEGVRNLLAPHGIFYGHRDPQCELCPPPQ